MYINPKRYKELIAIEKQWKTEQKFKTELRCSEFKEALERRKERDKCKANNIEKDSVEEFKYKKYWLGCDERDGTWCEHYGDTCCFKWCYKFSKEKK